MELLAAAGAKNMTGGVGTDTFRINTAARTAQRDTTTDFASGVDKLAFDDAMFGASLHFDADGSGAGAAEQVVWFGRTTTLVGSDILIA